MRKFLQFLQNYIKIFPNLRKLFTKTDNISQNILSKFGYNYFRKSYKWTFLQNSTQNTISTFYKRAYLQIKQGGCRVCKKWLLLFQCRSGEVIIYSYVQWKVKLMLRQRGAFCCSCLPQTFCIIALHWSSLSWCGELKVKEHVQFYQKH